MNKREKEIERIEQGEAWDNSDDVVQLVGKTRLDKVIPIRLPASEWEKLRQEARSLGIGPTTLARMWIFERLRGIDLSNQSKTKILNYIVSDSRSTNKK
jgi:hypothetical protein